MGLRFEHRQHKRSDNPAADLVANVELADVGVGRAHRSYRAKRESGVPWPTLAPHDDCNGGDRYRHMKKRYGNRQNMMAGFMTFAVPQLFLALMFKHLTFGEKLLFVLAVPRRLIFEVVGFWATVRCGDGVKILLDAFCLIKIPRVGCLVLQKHRGVLVAYCRRRFERLQTADSCGDDSKDRYRDRYLREKRIAQKSGMLGVLGVLEMLNWRFGHEPIPRAGKVGLYRGARITAIKADDRLAARSVGPGVAGGRRDPGQGGQQLKGTERHNKRGVRYRYYVSQLDHIIIFNEHLRRPRLRHVGGVIG
jgi:hypothetical protein